jgi:pimeloyl-ACP methyl ester carboxylesterase
MRGSRWAVRSAEGVVLGLLQAGAGAPLLLVHGGFGQIERWAPVWDGLAAYYRVTAMDRRGRGSSGDGGSYDLGSEFDDVTTVVQTLQQEAGAPVNVFAHSFGATVALGAAARNAPIHRLMLYEPAGPEAVPAGWIERERDMISQGRLGLAMASFLTEVVGLTQEEIEALRAAPPAWDILAVLAATLEREARALTTVDVAMLARSVACPVTLLLGERSPAWAQTITDQIRTALPAARLVELVGIGHEAIDAAPESIVKVLAAG